MKRVQINTGVISPIPHSECNILLTTTKYENDNLYLFVNPRFTTSDTTWWGWATISRSKTRLLVSYYFIIKDLGDFFKIFWKALTVFRTNSILDSTRLVDKCDSWMQVVYYNQ